MIYALLNEYQAHGDCLAIALAIQNRDAVVIQHWVAAGAIVHAMQANTLPGLFYCLYCRDTVQPSGDRPPKGLTASNPWHFEHDTVGDCISHVRNAPTPHALGIENPGNHGCYILLGCETTPQRNRRDCQTIVGGCTYCHLARTMTPPCV
ncbi:MAG: hypothetical protein K2P78_12540 [Gemmataceae bacterium]|nr:hypothetical protein [Gemmataceae bacterium]